MRKIIIFVSLFLFSVNVSSADQGVYVAGAKAKTRAEDLIEQYVQDSVLAELLKKTGEIYQRIVRDQRLQILPPLVYLAAQETVMQCFEQPTLHSLIYEAYNQGLAEGTQGWEEKRPQALLQRSIREVIKQQVNTIVDEPLYRFLVERILEKAVAQQRQILIQQAVNQQIQKIIVQQQIMDQALRDQYKKTIQASPSRRDGIY